MDHKALAEKMYHLGRTYMVLNSQIEVSRKGITDAQKKYDIYVAELKESEKQLEAIKEEITLFVSTFIFNGFYSNQCGPIITEVNGRKFK